MAISVLRSSKDNFMNSFTFICRNYHVFYYLLDGANEVETHEFHLGKPEDYSYLNKVCDILLSLIQSICKAVIVYILFCAVNKQFSSFQTGCFDLDGVDEAYEFLRLKKAMDMVGFSSDIQRK